MTDQDNLQLVQELYAAFGRGDVPAILEQLTDDVVWYDPCPPEVPHAGRYGGRDGKVAGWHIYEDTARELAAHA